MSEPMERAVWDGLERRLEGVEAFVPSAPPWRSVGDDLEPRGIRVVPGPAFGRRAGNERTGAGRPLVRVLVLMLLIALAVVATLLVAGTRQPPVPGFRPTGALVEPRSNHGAALLRDGRVLLVGGSNANPPSAELYDPALGTFSAAASLPDPYLDIGTVTGLSDGRVLAIGYNQLVADVFDPKTGAFARTGPMASRRTGHAAALLHDGRVLVVGGRDGAPGGPELATAELFDPVMGEFSRTGDMGTARDGATATTLLDGRVLVSGGTSMDGSHVASAELYDPSTGAFSPVGSMTTGRATHAAALLDNGQVLTVGGWQDPETATEDPLSSAEVFDPATATFSLVGHMHVGRRSANATLLTDGRVLITSGGDYGGLSLPSELFDPATGGFSLLDGGSRVPPVATATRLADGEVLIAGGSTAGPGSPALLYRP